MQARGAACLVDQMNFYNINNHHRHYSASAIPYTTTDLSHILHYSLFLQRYDCITVPLDKHQVISSYWILMVLPQSMQISAVLSADSLLLHHSVSISCRRRNTRDYATGKPEFQGRDYVVLLSAWTQSFTSR
jgi:hypothetical protein